MLRWIVTKLVKRPPSQRWFTKNMPHRLASSTTMSWAWRLVPTNSTVLPLAARSRTNASASPNSLAVWLRSTM